MKQTSVSVEANMEKTARAPGGNCLWTFALRPGDVTLDLINICLEKPFITGSPSINKSQAAQSAERSGSAVGAAKAGSRTRFLDLGVLRAIRTAGGLAAGS